MKYETWLGVVKHENRNTNCEIKVGNKTVNSGCEI